MIWVSSDPLDQLSPLGSHSRTVMPEDGKWPRYTVSVYMPTLGEHEVMVYEHRHQGHQDRVSRWPASLAWVVLDVLQMVGPHGDSPSVFVPESVGSERVLLDDLTRRVEVAVQRDFTLGAYRRGDSPELTFFEQQGWDLTEYWIAVQHDQDRLTDDERQIRVSCRELWDDAEITMAILAGIVYER